MPLLEIQNLTIRYHTDLGPLRAVEDVSFSVDENECCGIIGESGSGKSTIGKAIIRVLDGNAEIVEGSIRLDGMDLTELSEAQMRKVRWSRISMIPQSAMNALDPVYKVGDQIVEVIREHTDATKAEARGRARELFELVGLERRRIDDYPHQFSGGMRQRAMIAMALALEPDLIIADEPTTALDVIVQRQILERIKSIRAEIDASMILITHDISVVSETCDSIAVLYGGRVMEYGPRRAVIENPHHPYTLGLRNAFPSIDQSQDLVSIPGKPSTQYDIGNECRFAKRCPFAIEECRAGIPEWVAVGANHGVECIRQEDAAEMIAQAGRKETWLAEDEPPVPNP